MRKNVAKSITSLVAVTACFLSLITASVAWFEPNTDVRLDSGSGSTAASYFASGDGSEKTPYEITLPIHLYNLAWLQYLGQFNTKEAPIYFKLGDDIDMSSFGSALPPIGTESEPFIGVFDGGGYTISNLTVSDNITDNGGDISIKPNTVTSVTGCSVVGFFGIVGDPTNLGFSKDSDLVYSKSSISNFYLENVAVESTTAKTLIGVVAGYVGSGGSVSDIGVKNGSIEVANGATGLNDTYKETISKFSLIGDTEDTNWTTAYASGGGSSSGTGTDWGSSIDMMTLTRRVNYIQAVAKQGTSSNTVFYSDIYHLYDKSTATEGKWDVVQTRYYQMISGTYLPLSIDESKAFTTEITNTSGNGNSFHTTQFYVDNNSSEKDGEYSIIANNNAGYLVGGGSLTSTGGLDDSNSKGRGYVTLRFQNVTNWLSGSTSASTYDGTSAKFYSVDTRNGNTTSEITTNNYSTSFGYSKFNTVKSNFDSNHDGKTTMYGFHFYPMTESDDDFKSDMVKAKIFGQEYKSYQFLKGTLNFTTKSKGIITTILASSYSSYDAMFDLFKLNRDSNNKISSVERIKRIYKDSNGNYVYDPSDTTGMTLLFNFEQVASKTNYLTTAKALYYFEIPVNAGDYAIGKSIDTVQINESTYKEEKCAGANILYLDIGANASGSGSGTSTKYTLNNVRYVHEIPLSASTTSYADILFVISTAAAAGDSKIYFKRDSATHLYYYVGDGTNITVTMLKLKDASSENNASAIWPSSSSDSSSSAS